MSRKAYGEPKAICYVRNMTPWLAALLASAAQPAQAAPTPAPPSIKAERICRENETRTGSHIRSGRRCMTEEQWRVEDERSGRIPLSLRVTDGQDDATQKRLQ